MPTVTNSPTPPVAPSSGDLWFNTITGRTFDWYIGPSGVGTWVEVEPTGPTVEPVISPPTPPAPTRGPTAFDTTRTPNITVAQLPPPGPLVGDLWFDTFTGREFVFYDDIDGSQWVVTQPQAGGTGGGGGPVSISAGDGLLAAPDPIIGTGAMTADLAWFQDRFLQSITAGTGITVVGAAPVQTLSITDQIAAGGPTGNDHTVPVLTWNAQGQLTAVGTATITPGTIAAVAKAGDTMTGTLLMDGATIIAFGDVSAGSPALRKSGGGGLDVLKADLSNYATMTCSTLSVQASVFFGNFGSIVTPGVDGHLNLFNNAGTQGVRLDFSTSTLKLRNTANGADANFTAAAGIFSGNLQLGTTNFLSFGARSVYSAPADGKLLATNNAGTAGVLIDFTADASISFRNRANNANADVSGGNFLGSSHIRAGAAGQIYWSALTVMDAPLDGHWRLMINAATTGIRFDVTTDGLLKLRNRGNTADANLSANSVAVSSRFEGANATRLGPTSDGFLSITNQAVTAGVLLDVTTDATLKLRNRANSADAALVAGAGTFSSNLLMSTAANPLLQWSATGNGANLKHWREYIPAGGALTLEALSDAAAVQATFTFQRDGHLLGTTAAPGDNTTKYATTGFVTAAIAAAGSGGKLKQTVSTETGAVATGITTIPVDDTIPQNTEGTQFMSLTITPTSATNRLLIDVVFNFFHSTADSVTAALFQDSAASALAAGSHLASNVSGTPAGLAQIVFKHDMVAGTTSATTFKVRAGPNSGGTTTFNGAFGARLFGGVLASSITITEYTP